METLSLRQLTSTSARDDRPELPDASRDAVIEGRPMRAIVQRAYGGEDTWRLEDHPIPRPGPDEVLIAVRAAGIDRGTWHLMTGAPYLLRLAFGLLRPKNPVPGLDVSGTVIAIGAAVTRFRVGDAVFGVSRGSLAEYAVAREDKLARKPPELTFEEAAVMGVSALTALAAIDEARVQPGQRVLVIGASGGVGTYAVQLARAMGARVGGVCSAAKADLVTSLGADHVIDHTTADFADGSRTYDAILDIGGVASVARLRRALGPTGTLVIVGGESGSRWSPGLDRQLWSMLLSPFVRQRLTMAVCVEHFAPLERLARLAEAGTIRPVVERAYPLSEAPLAMRHLAEGNARGKLAIRVDG